MSAAGRYPGQWVKVEGLVKSTEYNGLFGGIDAQLEGGRYRVFLEDGRELSLKSENLLPVEPPQEQDRVATPAVAIHINPRWYACMHASEHIHTVINISVLV